MNEKFKLLATSHQGGVWERLIWSIRRILHSMVEERFVDEKTLRTFLIEREKILNDRPITPVSNDPKDVKALTLNHILLLRRNPSLSLDVLDESDRYSARWKHVHLLANEFRQRWTKEYLPTLQERQEWLEHKSDFKVGDLVLLAQEFVPGSVAKALGRANLS